MSAQTDQDWQLNKRSVHQRIACMFNNAELSDILLSCGQDTNKRVFNAHKFVLATSSPVFYRMFYGSVPEANTVIHLSDTDKEALEAFLRYLYTDETPSTLELALRVMYLGHKYMITALTKECVQIVKANLTANDAFLVLTCGMLVEEKTLEESAWQVIDSETRAALRSENFLEISASLLCDFLKRDSLRIIEIELFQAVLKWSEHQCSKQDLEVTGDNRRSVLSDAIYHLRFLAMSQEEFLHTVIPTEILKSEDSLSILQKFLGFNPPSLKWPVTKKRSDYLRFTRFDAQNVRAPGSTWLWWHLLELVKQKFYGNYPDSYFSWDYSRAADTLRFRLVSNKEHSKRNEPTNAIMFHGVRRFGDPQGSTYHVRMEMDEHLVSGTYTSELATYNGESSHGFDVVLVKPVRIELQRTYGDGYRYRYWETYTLESKWKAIKLTIKGPRSFYGVGGKNNVNICKHISVQFQGCYSSYNNNVDYDKGQIFQLLLTPCQPCKACQND